MGNCVESFGELETENVGLFVIVNGGSPTVNCLYELGLTGESCLESKLVMEDNVVSIEVFPHVAKGDMLLTLHRMQVREIGCLVWS